ncbi:hypothetical protein P154DRAFT_558670 [Amniculicola lignicola CBS 123094]|uniref:Uncharacterized protein n=1 Tax=Amniculicola lignicola CBS 123094 TaxID=1392246 RepID=A0A6A5X3H6_9PLEO|nr:hypothetical protein P154DRAFT_558670 [Amniculicola lignicola CBS 123094]
MADMAISYSAADCARWLSLIFIYGNTRELPTTLILSAAYRLSEFSINYAILQEVRQRIPNIITSVQDEMLARDFDRIAITVRDLDQKRREGSQGWLDKAIISANDLLKDVTGLNQNLPSILMIDANDRERHRHIEDADMESRRQWYNAMQNWRQEQSRWRQDYERWHSEKLASLSPGWARSSDDIESVQDPRHSSSSS